MGGGGGQFSSKYETQLPNIITKVGPKVLVNVFTISRSNALQMIDILYTQLCKKVTRYFVFTMYMECCHSLQCTVAAGGLRSLLPPYEYLSL